MFEIIDVFLFSHRESLRQSWDREDKELQISMCPQNIVIATIGHNDSFLPPKKDLLLLKTFG